MHSLNNKLNGTQLEKCVKTDSTLFLEEVWKAKQNLSENNGMKKSSKYSTAADVEKITPKVYQFLVFNMFCLLYIFFLKMPGNQKQKKSTTLEKKPLKDNDDRPILTVRTYKNL